MVEAGVLVVIDAVINGMASESRSPAVTKSAAELIGDSLACLHADDLSRQRKSGDARSGSLSRP